MFWKTIVSRKQSQLPAQLGRKMKRKGKSWGVAFSELSHCWGFKKSYRGVRIFKKNLLMWRQSVFHWVIFQLAFPSLRLVLFYFTMSASSWPHCTRCQGEVQTSCILWCEIKYHHCGSIVSWSLFSPSTLMFQWRVYARNRFGELSDMYWGIVHLSLTQQVVCTFKLFLLLKSPQGSSLD